MPANAVPRKKVAIVGSGCSGIAALWALNRTHHDVYLYEAAGRLGGHTNTVDYRHGRYTTKVDTGFIVMNTATYPNFINFLKKIGVPIVPTPMTFSVCRDQGAFEWAGTDLAGLFCQRHNIASLRMWRMIFDILRFNQFALDLIEDERTPSPTTKTTGESIGQYLERECYSDAFRDDYLIPMTAAVWSTSPDKCSLDFPAATLVRFLWNHHLLSTVAERPDWLTIATGAKSYIDIVMRGFPANHLFLNTPVRSVTNEPDGRVRLQLDNNKSEVYDHVILATHGDEAFEMIRETATPEEKDIMSCFHTSKNEVVLHSDISQLPVSRQAWSSWNYLSRSLPRALRPRPTRPTSKIGTSSSSSSIRNGISNGTSNGTSIGTSNSTGTIIDRVSLTYNMNILQNIPVDMFGNVLVTLNPLSDPDPKTVQGRYKYTHPLYTAAAMRAQELLPRIQNKRGISYAGAWTKYGFHEDGFSSGLAVAKDHLGAKLPFEFVDSTYSRGRAPELGMADWILRILLCLIQVFVVETIEKMLVMSQTTLQPIVRKTVNGVAHNSKKGKRT